MTASNPEMPKEGLVAGFHEILEVWDMLSGDPLREFTCDGANMVSDMVIPRT